MWLILCKILSVMQNTVMALNNVMKVVDWRGCFGQGIKHDAPSSFGLWVWPLEASHDGHPSQEAMGVHGQRFGLWAWHLKASHYAWPKAPIPIYLLAMYFQPISLDSHQENGRTVRLCPSV
jgi:hypothetical protein